MKTPTQHHIHHLLEQLDDLYTAAWDYAPAIAAITTLTLLITYTPRQ